MDERSEDLELLDESSSLFLFLKVITSAHTFGPPADDLYEALIGSPPVPYAGRLGRAEGLFSAVSRIIEDDLDWNAFRTGTPLHGRKERWPPGTRDAFIGLVDRYETNFGRQVDFARVQKRFLEFLKSPAAQSFLAGDEARKYSGIRQVIVDEYQDTNPVQEAIYFALSTESQNLTVVGDDDQALYRFRGASVDAMVDFRERCHAMFHTPNIGFVSLNENRRSHEAIVKKINTYLRHTGSTARFKQARSPKGELLAKAGVVGSHTPVSVLVREDEDNCAAEVVGVIESLQRTTAIEDLRQVVLLAPSTRAIGRSPFKAYSDAFDSAGIPLFNPRAKDLHKDPCLKAVLGALATVLDPMAIYVSGNMKKVRDKYVNALQGLQGADELRAWVERQTRKMQLPLANSKERFMNWSLLDLFYRIVAFEPFRSQVDSVGGPHAALLSWRLAQLTELISGFETAQGVTNIPRVTDNSRSWFHTTRIDPPSILKGVDCWYAGNFVRDLLAAFDQGGFDDAEDDIVSFPSGMIPALTIHQAKGLEFSIVFVCALSSSFGPGASHHQEDLFSGYRRRPTSAIFSAEERASHDAIRQHFVAFSRPKYGLVICLEKKTYDAILQDEVAAKKYPQLPASWLRTLPKV